MIHALQTCDLHAPALVVYPRPAGGVLACPWCAEREADRLREPTPSRQRERAIAGAFLRALDGAYLGGGMYQTTNELDALTSRSADVAIALALEDME